jgi:uncharacterized membrane protein HdeD (DUF308 family)
LVVGVLFCFSLSLGNTALSYIIGTGLIIAGILSIVNSYSVKKALLTSDGMVGAAIVAFGVLFAGNELTWAIFNFIPFFTCSNSSHWSDWSD